MVKEKEQKENNGQQNTMYYTENERLGITNLTNKLRELVCSGRVDNAYSTSGTRHVAEIYIMMNKGNNKITELRTIFQRESQTSKVYKQTKSVNHWKTVKTVMTLTWYRHF
jgi:membrane-bound inhibitor of C-type lysozyme